MKKEAREAQRANNEFIIASIIGAAMAESIAIEHGIVWLAILATIHITAVTVINLINEKPRSKSRGAIQKNNNHLLYNTKTEKRQGKGE